MPVIVCNMIHAASFHPLCHDDIHCIHSMIVIIGDARGNTCVMSHGDDLHVTCIDSCDDSWQWPSCYQACCRLWIVQVRANKRKVKGPYGAAVGHPQLLAQLDVVLAALQHGPAAAAVQAADPDHAVAVAAAARCASRRYLGTANAW